MATRYVRDAIGAVAAGASKGRTELATFDDSKTRTVTGVWVSDNTALIRTKLDVAGTVYAEIEDILFGKLTQPLDVRQDYGNNVKISYDVVNGSAGALAAGAVIVIRYEI